MKKILLAVPTSLFVENETVKSIFNLKVPDGYSIHLEIVQGYAVHQARNILANFAIEQQFDYIFWIDADIILPNDILDSLVKDNKEIVSGYYIKKQENVEICELFGINPADPEKKALSNILQKDLPKTVGVYGIEACGFGCTLIDMNVFKKYSEKYPDDAFFDYIFKKNEMCSEDILFCKKCKEIGIQTFVDTRYRCGHIGKKVF